MSSAAPDDDASRTPAGMSLRFALPQSARRSSAASDCDLERAVDHSTYFMSNATRPAESTTRCISSTRKDSITSHRWRRTADQTSRIHAHHRHRQHPAREFMSGPIRASVTRDRRLAAHISRGLRQQEGRRARTFVLTCGAIAVHQRAHDGGPRSPRRTHIQTRQHEERDSSSCCHSASRSPSTTPWSRNWFGFSTTTPARRNRQNSSRAAAQIRPDVAPALFLKLLIRTTPAGTILACGMIVIAWPSRFSMPCRVLLQAENTIFDGKVPPCSRSARCDPSPARCRRAACSGRARRPRFRHPRPRPCRDRFMMFWALFSARFITAGSF